MSGRRSVSKYRQVDKRSKAGNVTEIEMTEPDRFFQEERAAAKAMAWRRPAYIAAVFLNEYSSRQMGKGADHMPLGSHVCSIYGELGKVLKQPDMAPIVPYNPETKEPTFIEGVSGALSKTIPGKIWNKFWNWVGL